MKYIKVELHHHLDGALRSETAIDLMRRKGHPLPGGGSVRDLEDDIRVKMPKDLMHFLIGKGRFMPSFINDLEALERISYEVVEDLSLAMVAYCETRFSPFVITHQKGDPVIDYLEDTKHLIDDSNPPSPEEGLCAVLRGLERGERKFGTKVRVILCCIRGRPEWSWDVLRMCEQYRDKGVVGIDLSGNEAILSDKLEAVLAQDVDVQVFQEAKRKGIHRTVHTAESGPARMALVTMEHFCAERLGHGYRTCIDDAVFAECLRRGVHFEVCPHSSLLTGALGPCTPHPILRLVADRASWSYSTDDTILTGASMDGEAKFLGHMNLNEANLASAAFQAALHSFLPEEEKQELLAQLRKAYGVM